MAVTQRLVVLPMRHAVISSTTEQGDPMHHVNCWGVVLPRDLAGETGFQRQGSWYLQRILPEPLQLFPNRTPEPHFPT